MAKKKLLKSKTSKRLGNSKSFQSAVKKKLKPKISKKKPSKLKTIKSPKIRDIKVDLSQLRFCVECASNNVFYSKMRDELICRECGGIFSKLTPEQMVKYKDSLSS
jgi:ribosomal protein S27E